MPESTAFVAVRSNFANAAFGTHRQADSARLRRVQNSRPNGYPAIDHDLLWQAPAICEPGRDDRNTWRKLVAQMQALDEVRLP